MSARRTSPGSSIGMIIWCALLLGINGFILRDAISLGEDGYWGVRLQDITQQQLAMLIWFMPLNLFVLGLVLATPFAIYWQIRGRDRISTP